MAGIVFMGTPTTPVSAPPFAFQRLLAAILAAVVLATLCWAAIQVREQQAEARQWRGEAAALQLASRARDTRPAADQSSRVAELERRLAAAGEAEKQAAARAQEREKELQDLITFLRQENTAAQQTIERLSALQPAAPPDEEVKPAEPAAPVEPAVPAGPPKKRPRTRP